MLPVENIFVALKGFWIAAAILIIPTIIGAIGYLVQKILYHYYVKKEKDPNTKRNYYYDKAIKIDDFHLFKALLSWYDYNNFELVVSILSLMCKGAAAGLILLFAPAYYFSDVKTTYKDYKYTYENIIQIVKENNNIQHPTKLDVEHAEEINKKIKDCKYYIEDFKNDSTHYIDTTLLWARLCNDIEARRVEDVLK